MRGTGSTRAAPVYLAQKNLTPAWISFTQFAVVVHLQVGIRQHERQIHLPGEVSILSGFRPSGVPAEGPSEIGLPSSSCRICILPKHSGFGPKRTYSFSVGWLQCLRYPQTLCIFAPDRNGFTTKKWVMEKVPVLFIQHWYIIASVILNHLQILLRLLYQYILLIKLCCANKHDSLFISELALDLELQ
uniref:Uncharacterized protein n=1 Tax=Glossina austeni TaxID=7395 RepID=A0A1A9V126_GLOAU